MPDSRIANSILEDVKQMVGIEFDDTTFDLDIISHINTVFFSLQQLGVGPAAGFSIMDKTTLWPAYLGEDPNLNAVKSYMYTRVRLLFDPPAASFHVTALEKQKEELEWRLMVHKDPPLVFDPTIGVTP